MGEKISIRIFQIQDGGGVTILRKFFSKFYIFLNDGFPYFHLRFLIQVFTGDGPVKPLATHVENR